ncbi:TPA: AAA domain-containing protein [Klebsiella pneumoniae]|nr:AAA domain-containing protein [Klebsiella pneumoniae]
MALEQVIYNLEEVKGLSDEELYQRLYDSWGLENHKIDVWGELSINEAGNWAGIRNAKTLSGNQSIEYPLADSHELQSGVFLTPSVAKIVLGNDTKGMVACELMLASIPQRAKKNNPFLLAVNDKTVERLTYLPDALPNLDRQALIQNEDETLLRKVIYDAEVKRVKHKIASETEALEAALQEKQQDMTDKLAELSEAFKSTQDKITASTTELESSIKRNEELNNDNHRLNLKIQESKAELDVIIEKSRKVEESMARKVEKLTDFIKEKAIFLKSFDFLDEEDFDFFVGSPLSNKERGEHISFSQALYSNYSDAVSYIQAYLKERDILYPRHIIENFLTLIRTNDLIILAGDSGSGKTNLVQSFAKAIGGVSKIIPVKPNWTSSEDLLGYYNPLEKKYLATPFLEALIEAKQNPDIPYFICLDEMNLARVEYYFADFLSKLEERNEQPTIQLYSDDEAAHVLAELKGVVSVISNAQEKFSKNGIVDFVALMQDEEINAEMKRAFGFSDKDSLIKYHGDIRRMLAGVLGTPSSITIPANVRIIGAINIDETTHYLSPKILDRAHVMKFKSPLLTDWDAIFDEIDSYGLDDVTLPLVFDIEELGERTPYPKFERLNEFCELFTTLNRDVFDPLGVEFGMRTIRQGLNYVSLFSDVNDNKSLAINNFIVHKVLPKFTFDGDKQVGDYSKAELVSRVFLPRLESLLDNQVEIAAEFSCTKSIERLVKTAESNDGVVNYWA